MQDLWNMPEEISGSATLIEWFGPGHTFHDGEVLSILLDRNGSSRLRIHTWQMLNEVDEKGHFRCIKHAVVAFLFQGVTECDLNGFNHQNVVGGLRVERLLEGYQLTIDSSFGVAGSIVATVLCIEIEPPPPGF